jgi:hypothetical protein
VDIDDRDHILTQALGGGDFLVHDRPFLELYPRVCTLNDGSLPMHVLVIRTRFCIAKAVRLIAVGIGLSGMTALAVGISINSLQAGLDVFVALTGIMVIIQGCFLWTSLRR